jgi:hypothetical protein
MGRFNSMLATKYMTDNNNDSMPGKNFKQAGFLLIVLGIGAPIFIPRAIHPGMDHSTKLLLALIQDGLTAGLLVGIGLVIIGYYRQNKANKR